MKTEIEQIEAFETVAVAEAAPEQRDRIASTSLAALSASAIVGVGGSVAAALWIKGLRVKFSDVWQLTDLLHV